MTSPSDKSFKKRSLRQNNIFHGLCSALARSNLEWGGKNRSLLNWKTLLVSAHAIASNEPVEIVEGLEGELVNLRESTAAMSKARGASLIEYTLAFCAQNHVPTIEEPG